MEEDFRLDQRRSGVPVVSFSGGANGKSARWELAWLENPLLREIDGEISKAEVSGENHPFICQHTRPGKQPQFTMERSTMLCSWVNPLFLWAMFNVAKCNSHYQRLDPIIYPIKHH